MTNDTVELLSGKTADNAPSEGDTTLQNNHVIDTSKVKLVDSTKDTEITIADGIEPKEARQLLGEMKVVDPAQARISLRKGLQERAANWFSLIYIICTIPVGAFAMWMGSRFGLRTAILIAAWANAIGGAIRFASSFLPLGVRFPVGMIGQGLAACAYPFIMFLPTKVAGSWFGENERALATTIGVMSNPLGVLFANLLSPQIVSKAAHVPIVNAVTFVPPLIACAIATFGVTRSEPKTPPSLSAAQTQMGFINGLRTCLTSRTYLILLLVMGGGMGLFNCLYTVIQQLLCPSGYSNPFSGLCAALMISGGTIGAAVSGTFVAKTKLYEETMKVCLSLAVVMGLTFLQLTLHPGLEWFIITTCLLFGALGLATYPVGLEMSAECTFPVSETTSTGLIVLSGQVQSILYVALMDMASRPLQPSHMHIQVCTTGEESEQVMPKDNTNPVIMFSVVATILVLILILAFKPTYKRLLAEHGNKKIEQGTNDGAKQLDENVRLPNVNDEAQSPLTSRTET
ncbi:Uncharacterized protein Tcan_03201 [Toxocara canis]|uniref:Major facilitator superfamily domain-containing protein 7 n=1 Tax=Toxocara canis TaxID=6265 RepID=A0A0B2VZS8_TOXCA|nr:Uncharacterized protein Tcan_03201 [Toxocara canis]